jgi:nuclear pore complex protein Nup54
MFGASLNQTKPAGAGLFGASIGTNTQQQSSTLFGGLGQNTQQNQQPQSGGLFGQSTQQNQQQGGGLFGNTQSQPQQSAGLFGNLGQNSQQSQQQPGGLFGGLGQSTQQKQQGGFGSGFGQTNQTQQAGGLFGQNNQQQQQPQQLGSSLFGGSTQQQFPVLGQSQALWQPQSALNAREYTKSYSKKFTTNQEAGEKSIPEQIATVLEKWDTSNPNCAFKYYFYNKVEDAMVPYYRPGPNEDPKAWEEALSKKPAPGFIPVLCTGFREMGERIKLQQQNLARFNARLHEINDSLSRMMQNHETQTSIRAMNARRKHLVLKQRCLALATKVQVLRNRGYALGGDEEDLRTKLLTLEKNINDPGLGARGEEIWTRMVQVQKHAELLKGEIEKSSTEAPEMLDEEMTQRAKKVSSLTTLKFLP